MVNELHTALKNLYTDKVLPHLHSCLDEILWTSILRFEEMGFVEVNSYGSKQGSKTNFLLSNLDMRPKLIETLEFLSTIRPFSVKQMQTIDEELANAILRAQGPIPIAKLWLFNQLMFINLARSACYGNLLCVYNGVEA